MNESSKKINIVDQLSRHLEHGTREKAAACYLQQVKKWIPQEPIIHIDDSDFVKPDGYKLESLGIVRDGYESTATKNIYKKGYQVTEACVLIRSSHPFSIFSRIRSSSEKDYKSANTIVFQAIELRNRRKGKVKMNVFYKGKDHEAYLSHVKVQNTASRKEIYLVLVYGITEYPMMLATNKNLKSKEDVIWVVRTYFSRWKIEEYFRCKKQMFQFENFRVRKLISINALNFYITLCMAFLAMKAMESETNALKLVA